MFFQHVGQESFIGMVFISIDVEDIQTAFRFYDEDDRSGFRSFMYGKSTSNQVSVALVNTN